MSDLSFSPPPDINRASGRRVMSVFIGVSA